ncbi:MAG: hypothetical protein ACLVB1_02845 [Blautia obeum]
MKRIVNIRLTDWRWNMKEYELIWEIFNKCPRNQMRDVLWKSWNLRIRKNISNKFKGKEVSYEKTVLEDGTIIFDITISQTNSVAPLQKFDKCGIISFTLYGSAVSRKATDSV